MNLFELFVKIGADTSQAEKGMKNTQKNSETLTNKIKVMSAQFEKAQKNVDELTKKFNESVQKTGATSKETQELADKLNKAEKEADDAKKALDKYNDELNETEEKSEKAHGGLSKFIGGLGKGLATAAKIGGAALLAAGTGITALTTAAVKNYAEYEQLVGGVQTLFNKTELSLEDYAKSVGKTTDEAFKEWGKLTAGARIVQNNADAAFRSAGLSANEYMSTVTSFSASLIASLKGDTVAAAKAADRAVIDMADNANKMGTDMELIQNAYQGFAKQNYTIDFLSVA